MSKNRRPPPPARPDRTADIAPGHARSQTPGRSSDRGAGRAQRRAADRSGGPAADTAGSAAAPRQRPAVDPERLRRRAIFLRELAEARALRRRVTPRRSKAARLRQTLRMRTFRV